MKYSNTVENLFPSTVYTMVYRDSNLCVTLVAMTILLLLVSEPHNIWLEKFTALVQYNADSATLLKVSPVNPQRIHFNPVHSYLFLMKTLKV